MKKVLFLSLICVNLFGFFGDNDINKVKNGTLNFDESATIGDAIDNYQMCEKVEWAKFTTDNGRDIVQADCDITKAYTSKAMEWMKSNDKVAKREVQKIQKAKIIFQFVLNKNNDDFRIEFFGIQEELTNEEPFDIPLNEYYLKAIYNNEAFNLNNIIYETLTIKFLMKG
ncbi:hypothetical protein F1B92_05215 [Campylobacter sp. FMV-PI01]|uniref:Uncharacterized protein n=1 Tax=Campylobacter portucalensis TaxID=2608384 RepID=A0A6L5WHK4_9BACT|nr:hypothetical protein [Campylobacter portucalensis]MSN96569.1 hypothetical protein [Campylobacter portucalensis]